MKYYVIQFISQQPCHITGHSKGENFRYKDYLTISSFTSLSYFVVVVVQLAEHCDFLG